MVEDPLEALRRLVVDDGWLRARLLPLRDSDVFAAEVVDVARERGIDLASEQVVEGLRAARRAHLERWL